ncbi:MAG: TIGR04282 family arsenosugar biosynthesis glycosyltransferase [Bacteroidia bacterium]|nr:TIGR04282 family arsenosugar biosynthesis glycosyltransferase [Bacteroidia bacterium]NNF32216.1 glycosyltransferase [Flavobacteriaceae bacterium]MBT8276679.1 TIGR04282 family arsenosugar biosynthesis glycosyltransferase [Bacteroidia bacterium]NNJ81641.1 glycosyltransferase [Flavobacteriaceae bacterium]NNK55137.1 glycosyltransferase [Flavobacteriaceae bacterium]
MNKNLLLIFTRNPELGKVKTRLAKGVGDKAALEIYKFLVAHTHNITKDLPCAKYVYYSECIHENDIWDRTNYVKKMQSGADLGMRMKKAFQEGFRDGFENIIIIGSDMLDLTPQDLEMAFKSLNDNDYVIGPAADGGYYLLGMNVLNSDLFESKSWGTETVLADTLKDLNSYNLKMLEVKNDVDRLEDIIGIDAFEHFLNNSNESK